MYLSSSRAADTAAARGRSLRGGRLVAGNVLALGAVSFLTDISSEMVTAVLPLYLVLTLGLSPLQFGAIDGLYAGVTSLVRLLGGHISDRIGRPKLVAGIGYSTSAICKAGLFLAGSSAAALGAVLAVDRIGKGLRTAPRDALIAGSSEPGRLGTAFGVHRAMDTAGALAGPLTAFAVLWAAPGGYDAVFVVSGCAATLGVVVLLAVVREKHDKRQEYGKRQERDKRLEREKAGSTASQISIRSALNLLLDRRFGALCAVTTLLGLVTISDSFLYLFLQRRLDIRTGYFPLLPLGTAAGFLLLALPLGALADRRGARSVFIGGHIALLGAYLLLRGPLGGLPLLIGVLALHGIFYAATDGVLVAAAGSLLPGKLRTSGLALVQTGQAFARMLASILLGAVWTLWGIDTALDAYAIALAAAIVAACLLLTAGNPGRNHANVD